MTRVQPEENVVYSSTLTALSTQDLLSYCYQVARGLEYIVAQGVIHRDVAARNVLLTHRNVVKLADFAMAQSCTVARAAALEDFVSTRSSRVREMSQTAESLEEKKLSETALATCSAANYRYAVWRRDKSK